MDQARDPRRISASFPAPGVPRDPASSRGTGRESGRPPAATEPFDQRLERWVSRGRELVDGVSGTRPGASRGSAAPGSAGFNPNRLGRWVEERLDWLLDDSGEDDWREPWQESQSPPPASARSARERGAAAATEPPSPRPIRPRRGLEAISRRTQAPAVPPPASDDDWPDEASFSLNRWQRPLAGRSPDPLQSAATPPPAGAATPPAADEPAPVRGRPLPRSTRRR